MRGKEWGIILFGGGVGGVCWGYCAVNWCAGGVCWGHGGVCRSFCTVGQGFGGFAVLDGLVDFFADGVQLCLVTRVYGRVTVANLGHRVFPLVVVRERTIDAISLAAGKGFSCRGKAIQFFFYTGVGNNLLHYEVRLLTKRSGHRRTAGGLAGTAIEQAVVLGVCIN